LHNGWAHEVWQKKPIKVNKIEQGMEMEKVEPKKPKKDGVT
jgi:hypothetical protein